MDTKGDTVFFILTRLGHGWDTVGTRGHWRHMCTRGAREGHERCTRGAREGHKRGTRGAREGHERCTRGASLNFPTTKLGSFYAPHIFASPLEAVTPSFLSDFKKQSTLMHRDPDETISSPHNHRFEQFQEILILSAHI